MSLPWIWFGKHLTRAPSRLTWSNRPLSRAFRKRGHCGNRTVFFQSDVIMSAEAFRAAMEVVEPLILSEETGDARKVVIGNRGRRHA